MQTKKQPAPKGSKKLDIRDVARHAKVSVATVSRTINMVPTVNKQLAARVWRSIEELNYYPNTQARALVSGRSKIFALIISEITNPFFPELIQGFEDEAVKAGYEVLISATNYDPQRLEPGIRRMLERKIEGAAVMTFGIEAPFLNQLTARQIPLVLVGDGPPNPLITYLKVDYRKGIRQGVQHLAALGHRRIAFVSGPMEQLSCQLRKSAFLTSLDEIGATPEPELLLEGDHTLEGGMRAAEQLLKLPELATAVMCSNDMTAIGVLRSFVRAGIKVPDDISVIGFDDIHLAEFVYPPLTTVQMSRVALAEAAFGALRSRVEGGNRPLSNGFPSISTQLIVRRSTSFPRNSPPRLKQPTNMAMNGQNAAVKMSSRARPKG